jgi:hypothetical protein
MFFIIISAIQISGGFPAHHQELIKLYVQPWVLSSFPVVDMRLHTTQHNTQNE